jgi:formylglycine-generating enzyme
MTDIFISYAHEDAERVRPIIKELKKRGWSVFWDKNIPAGERWHSYISKALNASPCVIVIWSQHSIASDAVIEEASVSKTKGVLVPIRIDAVEPPLGFGLIQAPDLSDWKNNASHPAFRQCVDAITSRLSGTANTQVKELFVHSSVSSIVVPQVPPTFVYIHGGDFLMGSPEYEVERYVREMQHKVKLSDFCMGKHVVTVGDFRQFIDESGYQTDAERGDGSYLWNDNDWEKKAGVNWRYGVSGRLMSQSEDNHPVVHVSWNDAVEYCKWLSFKTEKSYRLPTEAEWEYACRAGGQTPFNTGDNLTTDQANYKGYFPYNGSANGIYRRTTVVVESFAPNAWGLYNMHGNVMEWCSDWYDDDYYEECNAKGIVENPAGPESSSYRVIRSGGWGSGAGGCRSASRSFTLPYDRFCNVGFRLVFVP